MKSLLTVLLVMVLNVVVPLGVQLNDRAFLAAERRERAWNGVSWAAALYAFGPLSMAGWVWVTRQNFWVWWRQNPALAVLRTVVLVGLGLALGLAMAAVIVALVGLLVGS